MKIISRYFSLFVLLFAVIAVFSCDKEGELPEGFKYVRSVGNVHFLQVNSDIYHDRILGREAGKYVCEVKFSQPDYCEVYMWIDESEIPVNLPILKRATLVVYYEQKNGTTKHRLLKENNFEE